MEKKKAKIGFCLSLISVVFAFLGILEFLCAFGALSFLSALRAPLLQYLWPLGVIALPLALCALVLCVRNGNRLREANVSKAFAIGIIAFSVVATVLTALVFFTFGLFNLIVLFNGNAGSVFTITPF